MIFLNDESHLHIFIFHVVFNNNPEGRFTLFISCDDLEDKVKKIM